jgi:subtilisin family serine protease
MRRLGFVSLLTLLTACGGVDPNEGSEPNETVSSALSQASSASTSSDADVKVAAFSVKPNTAPNRIVDPRPGNQPHLRSGQVLVKFRTPLVAASTMKAFRGVSDGALKNAVHSRLPGLERRGVKVSRVTSLHAPGRVRKNGVLTDQVTAPSSYVMEVDAADEQLPSIASKLAALPEVEWAEPNYIRETNAVPNDPRYAEQWHLPAVSAPGAWDVTKGRPHIVIAVVDSGVDYTHPDLAPNIWSNVDEVAGDGVDNDGNGYVDDVRGWDFDGNDADPQDVYGHGTHVAGIAGARGNDGYGIAGVAWSSRIMAVRAGNDFGGLTDEAIVGAIHYAVDNGADVINMSFGGSESSQAIREAIRYAAERDVVLVASAGNSYGISVSYPAAYPEVIAVAALDESGKIADFSSLGSFVDVAAPGANILSTLNGDWALASGTSMAAPVVAGLAALAKSAHPDFSADAIRYQVLSTASDLNAQNPVLSTKAGSGGVNAQKAVALRSQSPWVSLVENSVSELSGDGDGELEAGESARISATLAGFADASSATVSLSSTDPHVTLGAPVTVNVPYGSATAALQLSVKNGVPADHVAQVTLNVLSGGVTRSWPLQVPLARVFRSAARLPATITHSMVNLPSSKMALVFDNLDWRTNGHWRIYGSIRQANGTFSTPAILSNPATDASNVTAHAESNGAVHAVFRQYNANHDDPKLYYVRFDPGTSSWSVPELVGAGDERPNWYSFYAKESIATDAAGRPHVSWYDFNPNEGQGAVRTAVRTASGWVKTTHYAAPGFPDGDMKLLELPSGRLGVFYTLGNHGQEFLAEWNGTSWEAPRSLGAYPFHGGAPFVFDGAVRRVQSESYFSSYDLAGLSNDVWSPLATITSTLRSTYNQGDLAVQMFGANQFDLLAVEWDQRRFITSNAGAETEYLLPLPERDNADQPVLARSADGHRHAFAKGYIREGIWNVNSYTSYLTTAPISSAQRPARPVVTDAGVSTASPVVSLSWSVSGGATPEAYRLGVGTAPGKDDVLSFQRVTGNTATLDLGALLEPGRVYYFAVRAVAQGLYESDLGVSDGLVYAPVLRCTADPWLATVAYSDPGTLVTYGGNTYRSQWHNSGVQPAPNGNGPWKLVGACAGQPALSACDNPTFSSSKVYQSGEVVNYGGYEYLNLWYTQGAVPTGQNGNPWRLLGACSTN